MSHYIKYREKESFFFLISGLSIAEQSSSSVALQLYREQSGDKKRELFFGSVMVSMSCQL